MQWLFVRTVAEGCQVCVLFTILKRTGWVSLKKLYITSYGGVFHLKVID